MPTARSVTAPACFICSPLPSTPAFSAHCLRSASTIWYPDYTSTTPAWGLTPLEDQQLGGLIMWIPAGLVYVIGGLLLFAEWLRESDRVANARSFERKGEYAA